MDNSSRTNITAVSATATDHKAYSILGGISMPLNLLTIAVLLSDKGLLRKSALIFGLTVGNFLVALFLLTSGAYRLVLGKDVEKPATFGYCVSIIIPITYPLAFNIEAAFLFLSGTERLLAIKSPHWFRTHWTDKISWRVTGATLGVIFTVVLAVLALPIGDRVPLTVGCSVLALYGGNYALFISTFTVFCGAVCAGTTVLALIAGIRHIRSLPLASGDVGRVQKQLQITKSMVTVACIDVALVIIPSSFTILTNIAGLTFPWWIRPINYNYTHGINASVAFFAFLAFHSHFRKAAVKLFRAQKFSAALTKLPGTHGVTSTPVQQFALTTSKH